MLKKFRQKMCGSIFFQASITVLFASFVICVQPPLMPKIENLEKVPYKGKPVSPCTACHKLVESFLAAVAETTRQSFAGGDADWEKHKLGSYENSELRFIEIQEMLCADIKVGKDECYNLAELYESDLEDWFYEKRKKNIDLFESLCINKLKVCCPNNTYGPDCIPCPGGVENPCGGHGKCSKGGTREEPATCLCDLGFTGDLCNECKTGYYEELGASTLSCKKCEKACKDHCRGPGPKNCEICASGFHFVPDEGCVDDFLSDGKSSNMSSETDNEKAASETNQSNHGNTSVDSSEQGNESQMKPNIEDSTVDGPHSEL